MSVPTKDSALLNWSTNFNTRATASPTTFGLTAAQMTAYTPLHTAFVTAYNAANIPGSRSKSLVAAKNDAKAALLVAARALYALVAANTTVSAANKDLIDVVVRRKPTPVPVPSAAPALDVVSVVGKTVKIRLHNAAIPSHRGKPAGVKGAAVFSFVGAEPPTDPSAWKFEGNTTVTTVDIAFPSSTAAGAQVWLTAMWFNERAQSGPGCTPVGANLQFGSGLLAA
jgi:hypothetical protein